MYVSLLSRNALGYRREGVREMPLWYLNLPIFVCASVDQSFIAYGGEGGDGVSGALARKTEYILDD